MSSIRDILAPHHIHLALKAGDKAAAVHEVLHCLNGDARISDFFKLESAVTDRNAAAISECGAGICIAHGRTDSVSGLIMAVGRFPDGVACPEIDVPIKLVFVAGIPTAFSADYLRIVGAIARICRDKHLLDHLLGAKTAGEFLEILARGEVKL